MATTKKTAGNNHPNRARGPKGAAGPAPGDLIEHDHDREYARFRAAILTPGWDRTGGPLFATTAGKELFDAYLSAMPGGEIRQVHNCNACRSFFTRYGGLARIDELGRLKSAIWHPDDPGVPEFYRPAVSRLAEAVEAARIRTVFYSSEELLGSPRTGPWEHIHVRNPAVFRAGALTAGQMAARKLQDFANVSRLLREVTVGTMNQALALLLDGKLNGGQNYVGPLKWLQEAKTAVSLADGARLKDAALWSRVASAPEGFCHVRNSTLGGLLSDVAAGGSFRTIRARFGHKTNPKTHQRAQAAPEAGNIKRAEEIVAALGLAASFPRRYATLEEVAANAVWAPPPPPETRPAGPGVFGHLQPKGAAPQPQPLAVPPTTMTWEKFCRAVLPEAATVEAAVPSYGYFVALTAPENPGAPPLFAWDREGRRNPYSWYTYTDSELLRSSLWGLAAGGWARVRAVVPYPYLWGPEPETHRGRRHVLVLEGCADSNAVALGLFMAILRRDLYEVRATIEAHSKSGRLSGAGDAQGICLSDDRPIGQRLRVTGKDGIQRLIDIDRWD